MLGTLVRETPFSKSSLRPSAFRLCASVILGWETGTQRCLLPLETPARRKTAVGSRWGLVQVWRAVCVCAGGLTHLHCSGTPLVGRRFQPPAKPGGTSNDPGSGGESPDRLAFLVTGAVGCLHTSSCSRGRGTSATCWDLPCTWQGRGLRSIVPAFPLWRCHQAWVHSMWGPGQSESGGPSFKPSSDSGQGWQSITPNVGLLSRDTCVPRNLPGDTL